MQGAPGAAQLDAHRDLRDPKIRLNSPNSSARVTAPISGREKSTTPNATDTRPARMNSARARGLPPGEGGDDLGQARGDRPDRHDQNQHQRGGPQTSAMIPTAIARMPRKNNEVDVDLNMAATSFL
jgi:hypothetical protein